MGWSLCNCLSFICSSSTVMMMMMMMSERERVSRVSLLIAATTVSSDIGVAILNYLVEIEHI